MKKLRQKLSIQKIANALFLMLGFSLVLASPIQALSDFYDSSEIQFYESCGTSSPTTGPGGGLPAIDGETTGPPDAVEKVVWAVLTAGGIDDIHAAAIMGSIANEGGFDPMNTGYVPHNFDSKDPSNPTAVRDGYGLIGWTPGTNLVEDMKTLGLKDEKSYTAETQSKVIVGYLQKENKTGRYADSDISGFLGAKTLSAASKAWIGGNGWGFERPSDNGPDAQAKRLASAVKILNKYKGTSGAGSPTTNDLQSLAQQILDNNNVTYWTNAPDGARSNWASSVPTGGNKSAIDTKDVMRALAQGKQAYTTAANAPNTTADLNPNILKFILAVAEGGNKIEVNALTDKTHSNGSNHYKGLAVDIDLGSAPLSVLNPIAAKYGGVKNSESSHHHYDFLDRSDKGPPIGTPAPAPPTSSTTCCPGGGSSSGGSTGTTPAPSGSSDAETAFNYFISDDPNASTPGPSLSKQGAAGIVGNLMRETGGDSFSFDPSIGPPDSSYYGIAQWDSGRWSGVVDFANKKHEDPKDLTTQLQYIWEEMNTSSYKSVVPKLKNATDAGQAALDFNSIFEVGADGGQRATDAQKAYNNFKDNSPASSPTSGTVSSSGSDSTMCCSDGSGSGGSTGAPSDLDKYLKVLAYQESGGDPTQPGSAGGARGKYQYIDSTWQSSASAYYPPANKYATANLAPESVQDAVAYLEYLTKFKEYDGDIFKLAVSHFYPAANDNPALLDIVPPSNVITPRQYANDIVAKMNSSGPWDKIPLKYADAPDFETWLNKVGAAPTGSDSSPSTPNPSCSGSSGGGGSGSSDAIQLPVDEKWWKSNPDYFTSPHHDHAADDIPVPRGTNVYSMTDGKVAWVDGTGCGVSVAINPTGYSNVEIGYCHGIEGSRLVHAGETVKAGQHIFDVDNTGDSFGDHLHVQILVDGVLHCPQDLMKAIGNHTAIPAYKDLPTSGCTY